MEILTKRTLRIAIVGPCSAGKSTLRQNLQKSGYVNIRNPAQEHSYVPAMWQKMSRPDVLIYLDIDYKTTLQRRPKTDLGPQRISQQKERLAHARSHCDCYINTTSLTPTAVRDKALAFLSNWIKSHSTL